MHANADLHFGITIVTHTPFYVSGVRPPTTVHNSSFHAVPTTSSSTPLNLVMQQHQAAQQHPEQQKKETELWMPWQQPANHHPKENNIQDVGNTIKHPAFRPMVQI